MIPPRLRQAFGQTRYRIQSPAGAFVLEIGRRSPALALWLRHRGQAGSVLVTAWNPAGQRRNLAANRAAEKRFQQRLRVWGIKGWPAVAQDPKGLWPDERGMLLFGVPEALARDLGRALGQKAVLFVGADAVPRLLWL
jgi:hypothetical protein